MVKATPKSDNKQEVRPSSRKSAEDNINKGREIVAQEAGNSAVLPDFMKGDAGLGTENIGREDMEIPRIKLIQALSPEIEQFNDLRPGDFFHTASEFIFPAAEGFRAVPIYMDRRYILWNPRDSGGGILARADDGVHWSPANHKFTVKLDKKDGGHTVVWATADTVKKSLLAEWGSMNPNDPNSQPAATLMYNFVLGFPDHPDLMPAVLTFQRSSIRVGRKFNVKLKTVRAPMFGTVWRFRSVDDANKSGQKFSNLSVSGDGFLTDERLYNEYKSMYEGFKEAGLQVRDLETLQDEDQGENENDDDTPAERGGKGGGKGRPGF